MTGGDSRRIPKPCKKCNKNITAKLHPGLSCLNCSAHYHYQCAGIDKTAFELLLHKELHLSWSCTACNNNSTNKRRSSLFGSLPLPDPPSDSASTSSSRGASTSNASASNKVSTSLSAATAQSRSSSKSKVLTDSERISKLETLLKGALERINSLELSNLTLVAKLEEKSTKIEKLSGEIVDLGSAANSIEQNLVSDTLEVRHLPKELLEAPITAVFTIGEQINCPVLDTDFSIELSKDPNVLRLTFASKLKRRSFLTAGKQFNRSHKRLAYGNQQYYIHVNAELTNCQKKLYQASKAFRRDFDFKFSWYDINGNLWLKKCEGSTPHRICSLADLNPENVNLLPECSRTQNQEPGVLQGDPAL